MSKYKVNLPGFLMFILITISFFSISESIASPNCADRHGVDKPILARYENNSKIGDKKELKSFTLVRSGNRIAHSRDSVTEIWEKTSNQKVKLNKYFENAKRGIEYQPVDIINSEKIDWNAKRRLVSDSILKQFELVKQKRKNCLMRQLYRSSNDQQAQNKLLTKNEDFKNNRAANKDSLKLVWLHEIELPQSIKHLTDKREVSWKLVVLEVEVDKITQYMRELDHYSLIDYSDIGDNESDPFLQNMINLGFVAHSNPFYFSSEDGIYSNANNSHRHSHTR